jgi:hypothetical protein
MITAIGVLCCLPAFTFAQADTVFKRFNLIQTDDGVLVDFTMFAGSTCNGIRVERSTDTSAFATVHEFVGVCGSAGGETKYQFTDADPILNKISYYRLDAGLQGLYSELRSILYIDYGASGLTVFPNPCNQNCTWYFDNPSNEIFECALMDATGHVVVQSIIQGNIWQPETYTLANGFYFYQIRSQGMPKFFGKLLINKS